MRARRRGKKTTGQHRRVTSRRPVAERHGWVLNEVWRVCSVRTGAEEGDSGGSEVGFLGGQNRPRPGHPGPVRAAARVHSTCGNRNLGGMRRDASWCQFPFPLPRSASAVAKKKTGRRTLVQCGGQRAARMCSRFPSPSHHQITAALRAFSTHGGSVVRASIAPLFHRRHRGTRTPARPRQRRPRWISHKEQLSKSAQVSRFIFF